MLSKQTSARSRNCAALSTTEEKKWVRWGPSRVWCAATFSTFTHTCSCSMTTDCSVLFCCIFSITDSLQIQSQQTSSPADSHACYTVRLSPEAPHIHLLSFVVFSFHRVLSFPVFLDRLSRFPPRVEPHLPLLCHTSSRGSRASRGKEYRDKSRLWKRRRRASPRLYLCNKPLFYSLLQPSFYPFSHVMPNHPPKNDQLIPPSPPLLSHDDNRLHRWEGEKHPNLCDFLLLTSARWSTPMGRLARLSTGSHIKLRKPVICAAVLCSSRHIDSRFYQLKYSAKTNVSLHQS